MKNLLTGQVLYFANSEEHYTITGTQGNFYLATDESNRVQKIPMCLVKPFNGNCGSYSPIETVEAFYNL